MKRLVIACLICLSWPVQAQVRPIVDSLSRLARQERDPRALFNLYEELVTQWAEPDFDSSSFYARKLYRLSLTIPDQKLRSIALLRLGTPHDYYSHFDSAEYYYQLSLDNSETNRDSSGIATASFALATLYYFKGDYLTATEKYRGIEKMFIALKDDRRLARLYNNLGEIYIRTGQYESAISSFQNSLSIKEKIRDVRGILNTYANLSSCYQYLEDFDQALEVSLKSVELSQRVGDANAYKGELLNLGIIYKHQDDLAKSLDRLLEAERLMKPGDPVIFRTNCWIALASVYMDLKQLNKAAVYVEKVEAELDQLTSDAMLSYLQLNAKRFAMLGDYKRAYEFDQEYLIEKERVTSEKIKERTKELEVRFETEKKERQISQLELEKQAAALELVRNENQRNLFFAVMAGLLAIIGLVTFQYFQKQRINRVLVEKNTTIANALHERETLLKEIHHRVKNNLQVISSLLSLQSRNLGDEAAQNAISESKNRVKSMSLIHEQLYKEENIAGVLMPQYIRQLADSLLHSYGKDPEQLPIQITSEPLLLDVDTAIPIGLILNELLSNSLKHAFPENRNGQIEVRMYEEDQTLKLVVADNGVGKTNSTATKSSFGLSLVHSLMRKLRAEMNFPEGPGTRVELIFRDYQKIASTSVT